MARFALDPKPLFSDDLSRLLGRDESRLYGEICVTGWKNYENYDTSAFGRSTNFYANRWDRTLFMFGYNVPTFKILDVLSVEVEHKSNKYPNSLEPVENVQKNPPLPIPETISDLALAGSTQPISPWYWTVYVKKTFLGNFALIAQAAHDHMRPVEGDASIPPYEDVLEARGDWWWNIRLNILF